MIKLADTEFKGELIKASLIANPCGAGKAKTEEQTEKPFIGNIGNGAFSNLKGLHKTNAKMQMVLRMIAGNNLTETFGEDIQENNYASKIAGITARLDSQLKEEEERTGVRPERLNWSYARAENSYVSTQDIGITDERVKKHCEEMPVEEKAERVVSVQRFDGEMDVAGQRTHFRHNHWITGEFIEEHSDVQVTVNRPVIPLPTPVMKAKDKFPIAGIEGYEEGVAIFGVPNMMIHTLSMRAGDKKNMKRAVKSTNDINILKAFLTTEPQFASEIAEKAGMTVQKTSQLLKTAMNAGELKMVNKMNADSKKRPAFFI